MKIKIEVGSRIMARPSFGQGAPQAATITGITHSLHPREKYGESIEEYEGDSDYVCVDLQYDGSTTRNWAYGQQITEVLPEVEA